MREHNFCRCFARWTIWNFRRADFGFKRANYDLDVTGRYTLWDHGQRTATYSQAKETRNATENRNERVKQGLIFQITQAYYDVLKSQELVKVSKEILARSQETLRQRRFMFKSAI